MGKTKVECEKCDNTFSPHGHKMEKGAAVGAAAVVGGIKGGSIGWVGGPGSFGTLAGAGALMSGGAVAFGAKSITKCPNCEKVHII